MDKFIEDEKSDVIINTSVEGKTGSIDFDTLKTGGMIKQKQKDMFTVRLSCPGGRVPVSKLEKIVEVAKKYAGDYIHISVRQSIELPYVDYRDFGKVKQELAQVEQEIASCGARVRVPTACSGCEYNPNGITDTQKMAKLTTENFFAYQLPHKFKMSFSGCPIDCARTSENDLGFQGAVMPKWDEASCFACTICANACKEGAIESDKDTGKPIYHPEKCLYCGDCIRSCPADAWKEEKRGWIARVGGKHGRHPLVGQQIACFLTDEEVPKVIETITKWYEKNASSLGRIRIGDVLQDEKKWNDFVAALREAVKEKISDTPKQPVRVEIHFNS